MKTKHNKKTPFRFCRQKLCLSVVADAFRSFFAYPVIDADAGYADIAVVSSTAYVVYEKGLYDETGGIFFKTFPLS